MDSGILIKVHKTYRCVVAICDSELKGKIFEEGIKQLDLSTRFFDGEEYDNDELKEMICDCVKDDSTFYIVGEKSVSFAKEIGIITDEGILKVDGVKFALVLL